VAKSFELVGYLANEAGPVSLVLDFRNGHLKYPNNLDQSLNDTATVDKIRKYRPDYINTVTTNLRVWFSDITSTSGRLHSEFVRLLFLQTHRTTAQEQSSPGSRKVAALRINLNLDGVSITSKSHTHP
jgi:hypothetical protein